MSKTYTQEQIDEAKNDAKNARPSDIPNALAVQDCIILYDALTAAERERDQAEEKASQYLKDWYAAKAEFGDATTKIRLRAMTAERERDEEHKAHDVIASMCFSAGAEDTDGTSMGAVRSLVDKLNGNNAWWKKHTEDDRAALVRRAENAERERDEAKARCAELEARLQDAADRALEWQRKLCSQDDWTCKGCNECAELRAAIVGKKEKL